METGTGDRDRYIDRHGQRVKDRNMERDRGKGTEGQGWKDRDGRTGIEALRKGQRNMDSDSGTWTRSGTERQGHNHRDWDKRQEQVQTEGHQ